MPARSQSKIRRDINRLKDTIDRHTAKRSALAAIKTRADSVAALVNDRWKAYQQAVVAADKERAERDTAIDRIRDWVQRWRPVVLLNVPGAAPNIRALPPPRRHARRPRPRCLGPAGLHRPQPRRGGARGRSALGPRDRRRRRGQGGEGGDRGAARRDRRAPSQDDDEVAESETGEGTTPASG